MRKNEGRNKRKIYAALFAVAGMFSTFQLGTVAYAKEDVVATIGQQTACSEDAKELTQEATQEKEFQVKDGYVLPGEADARISLFELGDETSGEIGNGFEWKYEDGVLYIDGLGEMPALPKEGAPWLIYKNQITKVVISDKVTSIASKSFFECSNLTEVTIPESVVSIGDFAFCRCSSLEIVELSENVKEIGYAAYADCTDLFIFEAPGLKKIGEFALQGTCITEFVISKDMESFASNCCFLVPLDQYIVEEGNASYTAIDGVLYSKDEKILIAFPDLCEGNVDSSTYKPVDSCDVIGNYAFAHTRKIEKIQFNNVSALGEGAFVDSYLSGELVLPDTVTELNGNFTFQDCSQLTSVKFGNGFDSTVYSMFEKCTNLQKIDFGNTLTYLDMRTFLGCTSLTEITLPDRMTKWGGSVFNSCTNLQVFRAKNLEEVWYADFAQDSRLSKVELGNVKKINRMAFYNCPELKEITLPATVTYVDENAFAKQVKVNCKNKELVAYGVNGYHYEEDIVVEGYYDYGKAFEVLAEVNKQRKAAGLNEVSMDSSLLETAMLRAHECQVLFSHTRPDGTSCFSANEKMFAENIAIGQISASAVMKDWMNSSGHKANILSAAAKNIGIGCVKIGNTYSWVQVFGREAIAENCKKPANTEKTQKIGIVGEEFSEAITQTGIVFGEIANYKYEVFAILKDLKMRCKSTTTVGLYLENPANKNVVVPIQNASWQSKNTKVATVNANGIVTGIAIGKTPIVGKIKYYSDEAELEITGCDPAPVEKQNITPNMPVTQKITKNSIKNYRPVILSIKKSGKTKLKIKIEKVKGVTGYQIKYAAKKSFKKAKTVTVKKNTKTIKRPKKGKKCYVKVRCYIKKNGTTTYSKWSKVKSK